MSSSQPWSSSKLEEKSAGFHECGRAKEKHQYIQYQDPLSTLISGYVAPNCGYLGGGSGYVCS